MTFEERLDRVEKNMDRLVTVQDQMMDVLGLSLEGQRRLATRVERIEENFAKMQMGHNELKLLVSEIGDKVNALVHIVDGTIGGSRPAA